MKYILIGLIRVYQLLPFSSHGECKFIPTCSNYGIEAIKEYGSIKGSILTIKRIMRCNPLSTGGYDPVKKEKIYEKN
ncbi:MAG: membrane protein insertion efficiency factor YidD [Bacilli bacterium]|nr:membrane protein insertion efficiency factor YidD [Bacilli bacterium]